MASEDLIAHNGHGLRLSVLGLLVDLLDVLDLDLFVLDFCFFFLFLLFFEDRFGDHSFLRLLLLLHFNLSRMTLPHVLVQFSPPGETLATLQANMALIPSMCLHVRH
jgi:hypothetical protein